MCVNPRTRVKMGEYANLKMTATIVSVIQVTKERTVIKVRCLFVLCNIVNVVLTTIETLRSRFGDLTTNGKPRFSVSGFTLAVCPYLGLKIRGLNSRLTCLFSFVRSLLF